MTQLVFNFSPLCSYRTEDFILSKSNQEAYSWINGWKNWPQNCLLLLGPSHSGKTHLAHIFQRLTAGTFLKDQDFNNPIEVLQSTSHAFIIDSLPPIASEESFLHFFNLCNEHQRKLLLTADSLPSQWGLKLPDLQSRLKAVPTAILNPPDDTLIRGMLLKRFSDLQITISTHVLEYLLTHIERSYSALHTTVEILNQASLAEHQKVTLPLVKKALNLT